MFIASLAHGDLKVVRVGMADYKTPRERAPFAAYAVRKAVEALDLPAELDLDIVLLTLEWQRPLKDDRRPQNIVDLSAFAGIALGSIAACFEPLRFEAILPLPEEWKGQVPKHIKHNRIVAFEGAVRVAYALERAGIPIPEDLGGFTKEFTGLASDAIDAIGLMRWGADRYALRSRAR